MNLIIERAWALYGILFIIPSLLIAGIRIRRLRVLLGNFYGVKTSLSVSGRLFRLAERKMWCRSICWNIAWIMLVLAYSGIYWGSSPQQISRRGAAACFVFDISYSMMAEDGGNGMSRLQAAGEYAEALLSRMRGIPVSVVLSKGDSVCAIPLTEDYNAIFSLLPSLSPQLMTAVGSSPGLGIKTAIQSFPRLAGAAPTIIVFTDGEETDNQLASAVQEAVKYGISVIFVGFGNETGIDITAGDGVTVITSGLQAQLLQNIVQTAEQTAARMPTGIRAARTAFIYASAPGSAVRILHTLETLATEITTAYEMQTVPRYSLFICLALVFMVLGLLASEIRLPVRYFSAKSLILLCFTACFPFLQSCSSELSGSLNILKGSWFWHHGKYHDAAAEFIKAVEIADTASDSRLLQYGLTGLGATYIMLDENSSASERLLMVSENADPSVQFAVAYNLALLYYRDGDFSQAAQFFKNALEIDSSNLDAKINFELASRQISVAADGGSRDLLPASQENSSGGLADAVFSMIREKEQNKWKKQQSDTSSDSAMDY